MMKRTVVALAFLVIAMSPGPQGKDQKRFDDLIKESDLILVGKVTKVEAGKAPPESIATVEVEKILMGVDNSPSKSVTVRYAGPTMDEKTRKGESRIWFLRNGDKEGAALESPNRSLTVLDKDQSKDLEKALKDQTRALTLYVSNQSFKVPKVLFNITIGDRAVFKKEMDVGGQHVVDTVPLVLKHGDYPINVQAGGLEKKLEIKVDKESKNNQIVIYFFTDDDRNHSEILIRYTSGWGMK